LLFASTACSSIAGEMEPDSAQRCTAKRTEATDEGISDLTSGKYSPSSVRCSTGTGDQRGCGFSTLASFFKIQLDKALSNLTSFEIRFAC